MIYDERAFGDGRAAPRGAVAGNLKGPERILFPEHDMFSKSLKGRLAGLCLKMKRPTAVGLLHGAGLSEWGQWTDQRGYEYCMQTGHDYLPSGCSSQITSLADERVIPRRGESPWPPRQSRYAHHHSASNQPCSSLPVSSRLCPAVATLLPRSGLALSPQ